MPALVDTEQLKPGLIIFRREDVDHRNWYCRIKVPEQDRYKTVALKTADVNVARDKAYEHDADLRFRLKHEIPIFNKTFAQVASEWSDFQKERSEVGQITFHRWRVMHSHIKTQLNRYVGSDQITHIGGDKWQAYPIWRQKNGKGRVGDLVSQGTIRDEMNTFRAIMRWAAGKRYVRESSLFRGGLAISKARRDEFTPEEYRRLHTFARRWIEQSRNEATRWARTTAYNFILIMTNTGMRPSEARNLRWRDIAIRTDKEKRRFVVLSVRGKGKHRNLVAAGNVAEYLDRVRELSKPADDDQPVFTTNTGWQLDEKAKQNNNKEAFEKALRSKRTKGQSARTLYYGIIERLLMESKLLLSSSKKRRSIYCFRHTYATFRLSEGVDVFFLAKQMGTSVKMIEDHYGHITPVKNADRILQGMPGWESIASAPGEAADVAPTNGNLDDRRMPEGIKRGRTKTKKSDADRQS